MLKQFGTFIGWLSGSLAGISAIFYGLGFIATMAEDRLLGIGFAFAIREPEFYLERGGSLAMRTLIPGLGPVLGLVLGAAALRWIIGKLDLAERDEIAPVWRLVESAAPRATAIAMLVVALAGLVKVVGPALDLSGLLFTDPSGPDVCNGSNDVAKAILAPESDARNR